MASDASALTGANLYNDPYPVYARLRREAPVAFFAGTNEYFVTRYEDCRTVGANDRVFGPSGAPDRPEARVMGMPNVLTMSGEEHACLREGIDLNLTQERVRSYVDRLTRPVVQRFIDEIRPKGAANLTTELFEPISVRCIGDVIGLTETSNDNLVEWFHAMALGLQNVSNDQAVWDRLDAALADIDNQLGALYDAALSKPNHTLMSHVMHGGMPEGKARSLKEISPTMRVIILGGLQEPGHAAANACAGLLSNPEQAKVMAEDPSAHALKAFDEGLRWIAPIGVTPRVAAQDFEIASTVIPAGSSVAIVMGSANRDEARFENADQFDMLRKKKQHVSFGFRPHFCSGHFLSRAMGEIALEEAFRQLPNLRLDPEQEVKAKGWRFRGVNVLPAKWDA
ncbi:MULTISPECIES: cytochrome P450 [Sinorhizobium]|nr:MULTISPECIES: cytochrome P450 [Sinorhizobium]MCG5478668.1 cytochrome P450 [Sinorhizobium alkalisoli]ODR93102.1 cytochrome [Sinorhizobium alkalisoli]QFI70556.1 putative cytochrome P450 hydroxylase [Sinorhizobium alkalisoli]